ncbi:salicylic acid-binding protein 2-like [Salvia hispanica]|uniref:salicylic acid-binding protein 2-like n=1 Tax=Salvia hispanica TaxID=49212 RepID=UPI002009897D|nr:salicylic acid-binding protein 2-like [Salvia hispanica]
MEAVSKPSVHIVLVHGACHGAWCWYKLKPLLEAAGHRVTALDLAASGIDRRSLEEVRSLAEYSQPLLELMAALPAAEKVVLVGHSLGGMNISLAMEMYPHKIAVAVFIAAYLPGSTPQLSDITQGEGWLDTQYLPYGSNENPLTSMLFGPNMLSSKLYNLSSREDLELAKMLVRPSSLFHEDLSKIGALVTKEGYGSVKMAYVVCTEDKIIPESCQRSQIETNGVDEVKVIQNADHMPMISQPQHLCQSLLEIANTYA